MSNHQATIQKTAQLCVERMNALGLKGKRRDDEALTFWCGAAGMAETLGDPDLAQHMGRIAQMLLVVRGYAEIVRMSQGLQAAA